MTAPIGSCGCEREPHTCVEYRVDERDARIAVLESVFDVKHWPDCVVNHGGDHCDMGPECGLTGARIDALALKGLETIERAHAEYRASTDRSIAKIDELLIAIEQKGARIEELERELNAWKLSGEVCRSLHGERPWVAVLGRNLYIACALDAAFALGIAYAWGRPDEAFWRPGCGEPAPLRRPWVPR